MSPVNTMHPGAVASNFSVESICRPYIKVLGKLVRRFFRSAEQVADTIVWLASAPESRGKSGCTLSIADRLKWEGNIIRRKRAAGLDYSEQRSPAKEAKVIYNLPDSSFF